MKYIFSFLFFLSGNFFTSGQTPYVAALKKQLSLAQAEDSNRVLALADLSDYYGFSDFDSAQAYALQVTQLSTKLNYYRGTIRALRSMFFAYNCKGNYPKALEAALNQNKAAEEINKTHPFFNGGADYFVGLLNFEMKDFNKARNEFFKALQYLKKVNAPVSDGYYIYSQLGNLYNGTNQLDSALSYALKGYALGLECQNIEYTKFFALAGGALGGIYKKMGNDALAEKYFRVGVAQSLKYENFYFRARNYNNLSLLFEKIKQTDSAIFYARSSLELCLAHHYGEYTLDASTILSRIYESENKNDSTLKYLKIMVTAKDSVFSQSKGQQFQQFAFNEIQRQQEISTAQERYQSRIRTYSMATALAVFLLLAFILYRNNRQQKKAKLQIEQAYDELKSTQAQLVQSEKMASLGELTAGIAHEIQNPLNFVNNFSDINAELVDEAELEIDKGNLADSKSILQEIRENEKKINHHGKRAEAIVKGMLQHSRAGSGRKELTDINLLADEILRMSYHGFRAKDKTFNSSMETDFDPSIGKISLVPQDLGRVFQNLFNNSFYIMSEKKKLSTVSYEPKFSIRTKKTGNQVEIKIRDNGMGIPGRILNKIFQPFFTTKPTGQGTGLGLSLSYDIIRAHGGDISVHSTEGEFTEFVILLPA